MTANLSVARLEYRMQGYRQSGFDPDAGPPDEESPISAYRLTKFGWTWFIVLVAMFAAGWILEWFDHTTELTPDHDGALEFSFIAAGITAAISAAIIFWQSEGALYRRLVMSLIVAPIFSILGVAILLSETTTLIAKGEDFPAADTRTFDGLLLIERAYQTHGKGRSWNIQTTPIWSNLDVTEVDYNFMLSHRAPNDRGRDPDEISSCGYFCAKVTLQQAGDALRVLHAGTYKLPQGTVGICSDLASKNPQLPVIS